MILVKYLLVIGIAYLLFKRINPPRKIEKKRPKQGKKNHVKGGDYIDYEEVDED